MLGGYFDPLIEQESHVATIKDVARLAGVGLGTASRVVSGKGSVSPATLERVRKAIDELGFRPSHAARALLSGTSRMVGVYIPVLSGTFYTPILQIIDTELRAAGLHMVVAFGVGLGDARNQAIEGIEFLIERGCDGLIMMSSALTDDDIAALGAKRRTIVSLNHDFADLPGQCFTVDHALGGRLAARALLDHGHRDIAVIAGPNALIDNVARVDGFMHELLAEGLDTDKVWIAESDHHVQAGGAQFGVNDLQDRRVEGARQHRDIDAHHAAGAGQQGARRVRRAKSQLVDRLAHAFKRGRRHRTLAADHT